MPRESVASPRPVRLVGPMCLMLAASISGCAPGGHSESASAESGTLVAAPIASTAIINGEPAPIPDIPMGDPSTVRRVLWEGKYRNRVMDHLRHISLDVGPRLTGSSNAERANLWCAEQFSSWGLSNVHQFKWGEIPLRFDRGPSTGKVVAKERPRRRDSDDDDTAAEPEWRTLRDMEFTTLAWTGGTSGPVRGPVVRMPESDEQFEQLKDRLKGAWVLLKAPPPSGRRGANLRVVGANMSDRTLVRYAIQTGKSLEELGAPERDRAALETLIPEYRRLLDAGVAGFISSSRDERVWTTSFRRWRDLDPAQPPRDVEVSIRLSDYDYINSRLTDGEEFEVEFDLPHTFTPGPIPLYNTVAEIPGTDKADELVIVSAHLDSWNGPGSTGTTDNGTGSAVTLEAARLLMAAGAKPRRTIKFILWTGEEQGLLGSKAWVAENADLLPKISAVFVDDGGTNYEGGLKCTDDMVPLLAAATAPVNDQFFDSKDGSPLRVNVQGQGSRFPRGGGSDHASFIAKGVPGFFWDEVGRAEYGYGWHTQHDRIDLAIPEYLQQSATCAAITAYNLACAEQMLPRWSEPAEDSE